MVLGFENSSSYKVLLYITLGLGVLLVAFVILILKKTVFRTAIKRWKETLESKKEDVLDEETKIKVKVMKKEALAKSAEHIGTNVDMIYYTVLEKGSLTITELAGIFKVSSEKVEDWAKVLDKEGLLELHYPVVGRAELRVKAGKLKKRRPMDKNMKIFIFTAVSLIITALVVFLIIRFFYMR